MKTLFTFLAMVIQGELAQAADHEMTCTGPSEFYETFRADLINYHPGDQVIEADTGFLVDNYVNANLVCAGNYFSEDPEFGDLFQCVGYAFNLPDVILNVTFTKKSDQIFLNYAVLKGSQLETHDLPWPCTFK